MYDGILLNTLFQLPVSFWLENPEQFKWIKKIVTKNQVKDLQLDNFEEGLLKIFSLDKK